MDIWFDIRHMIRFTRYFKPKSNNNHDYIGLVCDTFINKEGVWKIGHFHSINRFRLCLDNDCENMNSYDFDTNWKIFCEIVIEYHI